MMFGSISEHLANLRHVKRCKTCVSGLNALFRGTEVLKHPFYSIGPKMMFGSVSEHFANLRHVKRCKTCVSGLNALFRGTEVVKHAFYSPLDPK
jgi:acid stress-induced BolA-like protein IbaG/YrbA